MTRSSSIWRAITILAALGFVACTRTSAPKVPPPSSIVAACAVLQAGRLPEASNYWDSGAMLGGQSLPNTDSPMTRSMSYVVSGVSPMVVLQRNPEEGPDRDLGLEFLSLAGVRVQDGRVY